MSNLYLRKKGNRNKQADEKKRKKSDIFVVIP